MHRRPGHDDAAATNRNRLLARIHRRYQTCDEVVELPGLELSFTRIADPNRVLDELAEEVDRREKVSGTRASGEDLQLPYWAELWDSAFGLAADLAAGHAGLEAACDVLDLGCGMGLAGTVAAALGHRVLFADLQADALLFAALNSLPWRAHVRTRRLNWQRDRLRERFDVILGADILYERGQWEHLERFWRGHLRPQGSVLLGEPGRQTGDLFPDWITARGWRLMRRARRLPERGRTIRIFQLQAGD